MVLFRFRGYLEKRNVTQNLRVIHIPRIKSFIHAQHSFCITFDEVFRDQKQAF